MRKEKILHILKIFKGESFVIEHFSGNNVIETEYRDYGTFHIEESIFADYLHIGNSEPLDIITIIDIECTADEETRISLIEQSESLLDAFYIAKYRLTERIDEALDKMRNKNPHGAEYQNDLLTSAIQRNIKALGSNTSYESVLEHLCVNTIGTPKIVSAVKNEVLNEMFGKIIPTIKKMEKEIF